jgi:hypothetical protein
MCLICRIWPSVLWTAVKLAQIRGNEAEWKQFPYRFLPENSDPVYHPDGHLDAYTIGGIRYTFDGEKYVCEKGYCIWLTGFIERYENRIFVSVTEF